MAGFFTTYDILLTPTMCRPPFPLGVLDMSSDDQDAYLAALLESARPWAVRRAWRFSR